MRVARRIRPSRVGCGATVDRRRLYAASLPSETPPASSPAPSRPPVTLIIHADGTIVAPAGTLETEMERESPRHVSSPSAFAGASARGK